ncbi:glycosyltransferase family 4 protein [Amaricoccus tamworthensis]|uniref:glycosyltransferase family 4 protein n=1 Tax=Amaricoccus tamworthensis TaxID=57002 RepID=UPI003C7DF35F
MAKTLAADPKNQVVFITQPDRPTMKGVRKVEYKPHRGATEGIHHYLRSTETAVINGQGAAGKALDLKNSGFRPDVMVSHPGWGEGLYLKDVFPDVPLLSFCEFYYHGQGADVGFDPEYPSDLNSECQTRTRNAYHLLSLEAADHGYSPTEWQKKQFPTEYHSKISVIHDGIDCDLAKPNPDAEIKLQSGVTLRPGDPVVTYVARNLEPYRGFHTFVRCLPHLFERRPDARVVVVGGNDVSYGRTPPDGKTYREILIEEVKPPLERVHFLGRVAYSDYLRVLQVSAAHTYLTYPFVLSWSMLEAMASGVALVGSATAPVQEVVKDGVNGVLVDFFDPVNLANTLADVLDRGKGTADMRANARQTVLDRYALTDCRKKLIGLISDMAGGPQV